MTKKRQGGDRGGAITRDRILDAATTAIAERGVAGLRIRAIARDVGIREGSIYNHFTGRADIIKAIFSRMDASMSPFGTTLDLASSSADVLARTTTFISEQGLGGFLAGASGQLVANLTAHPEQLRIIRAVIGARFHDHDARAAYEEVFLRDMRGVFEAACRLSFEAGVLPPSIPAGGLAAVLVAVFEHALGDARSEGDLSSLGPRLEEMLGVLSALLARPRGTGLTPST
jgi:AcrR family transcriptional regulator